MDITKVFEQRGFIEWFVIAAMTGIEVTEEMQQRPLDLVMTLNGVELDPVHALTRLNEEFDRILEEKVEEKISELIGEPIAEEIGEMIDQMREKLMLRLKS